MENLDLIIDLHLNNDRQGPGSAADTERAIELAGLSAITPLKIADIGCGTGASTIQLAKSLNAEITAVDFLPDFINKLKVRISDAGVASKITPLVGSMEELPFKEEQFDVIWSEGAIYNMGFEAGINYWKKFLKPGGLLVVSEITWLSAERPDKLTAYWNEGYPGIATASTKISQLEQAGYTLQGYFPLPVSSWQKEYYGPLKASFDAFLERHKDNPAAQSVITAEEEEMALYDAHTAFYSYGMYIARKN